MIVIVISKRRNFSLHIITKTEDFSLTCEQHVGTFVDRRNHK